ncbi:MAG: hypothetical protein KAI66_00855 [Lentisphaeria bacterium]|nr:hypothetical protein [Lentisphaeria bacterium]
MTKGMPSLRYLTTLVVLVATLQAADPKHREFQAIRTDSPPVIDGKLDDPCWQKSQVAADWRRFAEHTPALEASEARLLFDDTYLYFGLHCAEPRMDLVRRDVAANPSKFNYSHGNTVEIFLDPGGSKQRYWQFMINTNGTTEAHLATRDVMHIGNLAWQAKVALGHDSFTIEVAVPLAILHLTPEAGMRWGLNFCRARQIGKQESAYMYSSWQPMRGSFLQPAQFGTIRFDTDFSRLCFEVTAPQIVKPGKSCRIEITNRTGKSRRVKAAIDIKGVKTSPRREQASLYLADAEHIILDCGIFGEQDVGAEIRVTLRPHKPEAPVHWRNPDNRPNPVGSPLQEI